MGGFYRLMEWIMRLSVINVLWVAVSAPIFLLGLTMLISLQTNVESVVPLLVLIVILTPFLLFPGTSAMFTVVRKWVMGDVDAPLFKTFFRGYKDNYVQSMLAGLVYTLLGVLNYTNFMFYAKQDSSMSIMAYIFIPLSVILCGAVVHFFSLVAHFHMKFWLLIKNSIVVTLSHPFTSLSILVVNGTIIYVSMTWLTFMIPFFMGTCMAYFSFWSFYRIYHRIQEKQEAFNKKDEAELEESGQTE